MTDLVAQIDALLALNANGAVSHPVPGLAVELLERAKSALGRQRLPDRRHADAIPTTHIYAPGTAQEIHEHMTLRIGRYDDGRIGEVFIDYTDPSMYRNERAKNLGHDIATLLSIALQYGVPLQVLRDAVGRGEVPWLGEIREYPHTPIGTVLDALWAASQPQVGESTNA